MENNILSVFSLLFDFVFYLKLNTKPVIIMAVSIHVLNNRNQTKMDHA